MNVRIPLSYLHPTKHHGLQEGSITMEYDMILKVGPNLNKSLQDTSLHETHNIVAPMTTGRVLCLSKYNDIIIKRTKDSHATTVTEKTSYGLGCTTTDRETAKINPFPICKRSNKSDTKRSRDTPYSGRLMQIPVELFPILLALVIHSQQQ